MFNVKLDNQKQIPEPTAEVRKMNEQLLEVRRANENYRLGLEVGPDEAKANREAEKIAKEEEKRMNEIALRNTHKDME